MTKIMIMMMIIMIMIPKMIFNKEMLLNLEEKGKIKKAQIPLI